MARRAKCLLIGLPLALQFFVKPGKTDGNLPILSVHGAIIQVEPRAFMKMAALLGRNVTKTNYVSNPRLGYSEMVNMANSKCVFDAVWMIYGKEKSLQFTTLLLQLRLRGRYTVNNLITCYALLGDIGNV